jgi:hypothetical protein
MLESSYGLLIRLDLPDVKNHFAISEDVGALVALVALRT